MIQATFRVVSPGERQQELIEVLSCMKEPTEALDGCRGYQILQDVNDRRAISWLEWWDCMADLEAHIRSDRFRRLLPYIEMSVTPPEVMVGVIDPLHGMEFVVNTIVSEQASENRKEKGDRS